MAYWQSAQVLASFALKDYVAGTADNNLFVVVALTRAANEHPGFSGMECVVLFTLLYLPLIHCLEVYVLDSFLSYSAGT